MLNFFCFVLIALGVFTILRSCGWIEIIIQTMDDNFFGKIVDKNLQNKVKIIDYMLIVRWAFILFVGLFLCVHAILLLVTSTINTPIFIFVIVFLFFVQKIILYTIFKKHDVLGLYREIKNIWNNEEKISDRHDEEVAFIRDVDELNGTWEYDILWVIGILLYFL